MINFMPLRMGLATRALALLLASMTLGAASTAHAAVIDFEGKTGSANSTGDTITVDGFTFTQTSVSSSGFSTITTQNDIVEPGTTKLFMANHSSIEMSMGGAAFSLSSFDLGGSFVNNPNRWADQVKVTATFFDTTISSLFVDLPLLSPTYVGTDWALTNVVGLLFEASGSNGTGINDFEFVLDNIAVNMSAVPVPAGLPLLLIGLGSFGLVSRRRKQPSAA